MHDIDRTQREMEIAVQELQPEQFEFPGETETWGETTGEFPLQELQPEQFEFQGEAETYGETQAELPLNEADEMELAAEFLEVTNEAELDHFLGGLFRKVGGVIGKVVKSPVGRALGGFLKPLAKAALPIAGRALGTFVGGPVGGAIGGKLASAAGGLFGLELEGMSAEDREFEVSRRFVRLASAATKNAAFAPPTANPNVAAKAAVMTAARKLAPGLVRGGNGRPTMPAVPSGAALGNVPVSSNRRGIWIRRGRRIMLLGV
jgi:hypothetical protein